MEAGVARDYAEKCAVLLDLEKCTVPGSNKVLRKLITGEWDEDIIVRMPGEKVTDKDFEFGGEKCHQSGNIWIKDIDANDKF